MDKEKFLDCILREWSEHFIVDYSASVEFVHYMCEEFGNYGKCSLIETMDRIYLEHRHGYHFDGGITYAYGIHTLMPLQSKTLFKLHHNIFDIHKSIKLQMDVQNCIEPYLGAFDYDSDEDNADKKRLHDILYYKKAYHRYLAIDELSSSRDTYDISVCEKRKNIVNITSDDKGAQTDFYQEMLDAWYALCNYSSVIKEKLGVAVWHYIKTHSEDSERKKLRYLYNKIMSLKDQIDIFQEI